MPPARLRSIADSIGLSGPDSCGGRGLSLVPFPLEIRIQNDRGGDRVDLGSLLPAVVTTRAEHSFRLHAGQALVLETRVILLALAPRKLLVAGRSCVDTPRSILGFTARQVVTVGDRSVDLTQA